MRGVIYARYSEGPRQTDQSIEGQVADCRAYAEQKGIDVIGIYADRHISGTSTSGRDEFLRMIHALDELETHARIRAERSGGAPDDLYRERRAVRAESARIAARFFGRCREALPAQNPQSPLAEALRYAAEHENVLSAFLYDPELELSRANPETPVAGPLAVLAVCADECLARGVSFRAWLERTLVRLKQPDPPPPDTLFPS